MINNEILHACRDISVTPSGPVSGTCPGLNEEQQIYRLIQDGKEIILVGTVHPSKVGTSVAIPVIMRFF